jgi:hypothetical protein
MSTRLTEALVTMSVVQTGPALEARFLVSNARFLGSGAEGFQESYVLQQRFGEPLALSRITASGRWFSGQNADGALKVELTLSKDSRTLQGSIKVEGAWYGVSLRRK